MRDERNSMPEACVGSCVLGVDAERGVPGGNVMPRPPPTPCVIGGSCPPAPPLGPGASTPGSLAASSSNIVDPNPLSPRCGDPSWYRRCCCVHCRSDTAPPPPPLLLTAPAGVVRAATSFLPVACAPSSAEDPPAPPFAAAPAPEPAGRDCVLSRSICRHFCSGDNGGCWY